jgi:hypothetical protein
MRDMRRSDRKGRCHFLSGHMLKQDLDTWSDFDLVMHSCAASLGLFANDACQPSSVLDVKSVYGTANPIGECLHEIVMTLTKIGALEHDELNEKWRWNPNFKVASTK